MLLKALMTPSRWEIWCLTCACSFSAVPPVGVDGAAPEEVPGDDGAATEAMRSASDFTSSAKVCTEEVGVEGGCDCLTGDWLCAGCFALGASPEGVCSPTAGLRSPQRWQCERKAKLSAQLQPA